MILLLNKRDLFAKKIQDKPINVCPAFRSYDGAPDSFEQSLAFICETFTSVQEDPKRNIFTFATNALNGEDMLVEYTRLNFLLHFSRPWGLRI